MNSGNTFRWYAICGTITGMAANDDELIRESVQKAKTLLEDLALTPAERDWAKQQASKLFKDVTDELLNHPESMVGIRALAAPAALAYALTIASDWATHSEKLRK